MIVAARPGGFDLDPAQAAVIVVDMQNDFGSPGGAFARLGIDVAPIADVVAPIARVLDAARGVEIPTVFLKTGFAADLSDLGPEVLRAHPRTSHTVVDVGTTVTAPDGSGSRVLVRDTWSTDIVDALAPAPGDHIVWKRRYGGFYETELDAVLRGLGARDLIFTGCTTSVCVESTLREAMFRGFHCLLLEDCCAEPIGASCERSNHEASLLVVESVFGWVAPSAALLAALTPAAAQA